jgi:hypothetical protein
MNFNPFEYNTNSFETKKSFGKGNSSNFATFPPVGPSSKVNNKSKYVYKRDPKPENNCAFEFNIPVQYTTTDGFKKQEQESQEPLKYKFDISPYAPPFNPCLGPTQQLQGVGSNANKRPPASLIAVEDYLKKSGVVIETNKAIIFDKNVKPSMPNILNNKMRIPECKVNNAFETTKTQRHEMPQYNTPTYPKGHYQTDVMNSGIDTRQEVKDNYKQPNHNYTIPVPTMKPFNPSTLSPRTTEGPNSNVPYYSQVYPCNKNYNFKNCQGKNCKSKCCKTQSLSFNPRSMSKYT